MKTTKWVTFDFNSDGWSDTHENRSDAFPKFVRDFRSDVRTALKGSEWAIAELKGHYFYVSGFLYNSKLNRYVYLSISDVRYFAHSWTNILIRTAKNTKDFTGGRNNYTNLKTLRNDVENLTPYMD